MDRLLYEDSLEMRRNISETLPMLKEFFSSLKPGFNAFTTYLDKYAALWRVFDSFTRLKFNLNGEHACVKKFCEEYQADYLKWKMPDVARAALSNLVKETESAPVRDIRNTWGKSHPPVSVDDPLSLFSIFSVLERVRGNSTHGGKAENKRNLTLLQNSSEFMYEFLSYIILNVEDGFLQKS